jgi:hypothetical protein
LFDHVLSGSRNSQAKPSVDSDDFHLKKGGIVETPHPFDPLEIFVASKVKQPG